MRGFRIAGGSVPGKDHIRPGESGWTNNQDAFAWRENGECLAAVVCDGCGASPFSEVGAQLGAALVANKLAFFANRISTVMGTAPVSASFPWLADWITTFIARTAQSMGREPADIAEDYFLFTMVGVLMTPTRTFVFEAGDGFYAINGQLTKINNPFDNAPPYLGHLFTGNYPKERIGIRVRVELPTADVESLLIATDGMRDVIAHADRQMPTIPGTLGPVSQFWTEDRFVANADMIRRRLALANVESVENGRIRGGLLTDDTTIIVIRRMPENDEPVIALEPIAVNKGDSHA